MNKIFKIIWKIIQVIFPYVLIFVFACKTTSEIKAFYSVINHTVNYFAFACYVLVACTALVLVWVTWLFRRLKKKLDRLLEEKEERMFVLRYQANPASFQKNDFSCESTVNEDPET